MSKKKLYISIIVLLVGLATFIQSQTSHGMFEHEHRSEAAPIEDTTTLLPIHQVINNGDSDLSETARFDRAIEHFMSRWDIQGASFALMKDERLIYSKGYGFADKENNIETDVMHIFRIASVSKLITAVAIMKLVEEGKIKLNQQVFGTEGILNDSIYLDFYDKRVKMITVEDLLRHQGGFSTAFGDPMFNPIYVANAMNVRPPAGLDTMIKFILSKRLRFTPGHGTVYSNIGYGILSRIIEKTTNCDYEDYIQEQILFPAGCFDMHLGKNTYMDKFYNEVKYYEQFDAELIPACDGTNILVRKCNGGNNIEGLYGAGGWVASPSELLRFLASINKKDQIDNILSDSLIDYMTYDDPRKLPIGWMHTRNNGEWQRTGTLAGTSVMLKQESNGYSWVFVTNTSNWKGSRFTKTINYTVSQEIKKVKEWPSRDLFDYQDPNSTALLVIK